MHKLTKLFSGCFCSNIAHERNRVEIGHKNIKSPPQTYLIYFSPLRFVKYNQFVFVRKITNGGVNICMNISRSSATKLIRYENN